MIYKNAKLKPKELKATPCLTKLNRIQTSGIHAREAARAVLRLRNGKGTEAPLTLVSLDATLRSPKRTEGTRSSSGKTKLTAASRPERPEALSANLREREDDDALQRHGN